MTLRIELRQDPMFIDKKKNAHRGSYSHFVGARQSIDLGKFRVSVSRGFYQASYGVDELLGKGGDRRETVQDVGRR